MAWLSSWESFVKVVESGSMAAAARRLDCTRAQISKQIGELEQVFGVRLFERSTRKLSLTPSGAISKANLTAATLLRLDRKQILLTRFDRRRRMSDDVRNKLRERYGKEVLETVISENVAVAESPSLNQDVFRHNPSSTGAHDYRSLLDELIQRKDL